MPETNKNNNLPNLKSIPALPKNKPNIKSKVPVAPMVPDKLLKVSPEDRKYATAISNIIINCNSALKQYKKDVPKNKINSEPNREQIINAVLTCKDFKRLKKTYKNSLEFLEKAEIKFFHTNKTPEDVRKSLDRIIEKIKLEKKEHSANKKAGIKALTPAEKKIYVEEALKFIANSKFPNFIKTRCLPDISKFFEKNADILYHQHKEHGEAEVKKHNKNADPNFKDICKGIFKTFNKTKIYKLLENSKSNTFKDFQEEFIKDFKILYKKALKTI